MRIDVVLSLLAALLATSLSIWGVAQGRRTLTAISFAAGMLLLGADEVLRLAAGVFAFTDAGVTWARCRMALVGVLPPFWLAFSLCYARGNAAEFLRRWRMVLLATLVAPVAIAAAGWRHILDISGMEFSDGVWLIPLGPAGKALIVLTLIGLVLALDNLERTLRSAVGTMRWRIKFLIVGLGAIIVIRIYTASQALLYSAWNPGIVGLNTVALLLGGAMIARGLARTRLTAVSLYPPPRKLHASPAIMLAGLYLLLIGLVAQAAIVLGGVANLPLKNFLIMFALLGLAVVLLSDRVHLWSGEIATRYFRRPRHDYARIWRACAEKTASIVSPGRLCREIAGILSNTLDALSVTIWRVDETRNLLVMGASTFLPLQDGQPGPSLDAEIMRMLVRDPHPVNLEKRMEPWAGALRDATPRAFPEGGDRVAVPLCAAGALQGLMIVADRVRGRPLTVEDLGLLRTIGDHVGSSLLNLRLSERLLESREMAAFQKMSTFFIHDLKNTASSLSLLLENFRIHSNNPSFREDALKAIEASVTRLRDLIRRLGRLREVQEINMQACSLSEIVDDVLGQIAVPEGVRLVRENAAPPPIMADRKQIESVVANLVLNALQALPAGAGAVHVSMAARERGAVLTVQDNGCGMSKDFMQKSLFHPFRTTKSGGMGIGLFQSRTIVEGHGGFIEVDSEEGRGTVFRVVFPPMVQ